MANKENENKNDVKLSNTRNEVKRDSEFSLSRKVSIIRESLSDSGVVQRKSSSTVDVTKRNSLHSQDQEVECGNHSHQGEICYNKLRVRKDLLLCKVETIGNNTYLLFSPYKVHIYSYRTLPAHYTHACKTKSMNNITRRTDTVLVFHQTVSSERN